jgi:predicted RecA/RadA family phage recombinase
MADYSPIFQGPPPYTSTASATITGGQVLEVSGSGTVGPAAAGSVKVVGVAAFDAATNAQVTIFRGGVQELVASGTVTQGEQVEAAASGQVRTLASGRAIGVALTTATNGNKTQIVLTA